MAGADVAVARDSAALNSNPAGLAALQQTQGEFFSGAARALDVGHADRYGNDLSVSNRWALIGGGSIARPWGKQAVVGAGLFVQGGAGASYRRLNTAFGTQDELTALTGILRVAVGGAWRVSEQLALGLTVSALFAKSEQRIYPATSVQDNARPEQSFYGQRLEGAKALRPAWRLGVQFRPRPDVTLGAVYAPRVALPFSGNQLTLNLRAAGLGDVQYRDVRLEGLALPREISLGAAWQATPDWLFSTKVSRLAWSKSIGPLTLRASDPDDPRAPPSLQNTQRVTAYDRTLFTFGVRHELGSGRALLAGFNRMKRPLDDNSLSPTFAPIAERHLTLGGSQKLHAEADLSAGLEYQLGTRVRYTNPALPFGVGAEERSRYLALHLSYSRRW